MFKYTLGKCLSFALNGITKCVCWVLDCVRTWKFTYLIYSTALSNYFWMKPAIPEGLINLSADIIEFEEKMILDNSREFAMVYEIFKQRGEMRD